MDILHWFVIVLLLAAALTDTACPRPARARRR